MGKKGKDGREREEGKMRIEEKEGMVGMDVNEQHD